MSDAEMTAKFHASAQDALSAARRDEIVIETLELGKRNPELKIGKSLELLISDLSNP